MADNNSSAVPIVAIVAVIVIVLIAFFLFRGSMTGTPNTTDGTVGGGTIEAIGGGTGGAQE